MATTTIVGCDENEDEDDDTDADRALVVSPDGDEVLPASVTDEEPIHDLVLEDEDAAALVFRWFNPSSQTTLASAGGSGGSDFGLLGLGVMYGFGGRSGARVDQLRFGFYQPSGHPGPYYEPGDPWWTVSVGGGGGSAFSWTACPAGYGAVGYQGRSGSRIDRFGLICAPLWNRNGGLYYTPQYGGGGGSYFARVCPNSRWLIGMRGRTGSEVDQLRGVCGYF